MQIAYDTNNTFIFLTIEKNLPIFPLLLLFKKSILMHKVVNFLSKKYYWLKLKDNFFNNKEIKKLRKIAGGDTFTIIYLKMQLLSIKKEGIIRYDGTETDLAEQLSLEIDEDIDNIKITLSFLQANKLIEQVNENDYLLNKVPECIGSETSAAERMRRLRKKQEKLIPSNTSEQERNKVTEERNKVTQRKELEKEKDIYEDFDEETVSKNQKRSTCMENEFEEIWQIYPRKKGKARARKKFKTLRQTYTLNQLRKAIKRYKDEVKDKDKKYIMYGSTFFTNGYEDYINEDKPPKPKPELKIVYRDL